MSSINELIILMEYKRDNIKAHMEPKVFDEVAKALKDYKKVNSKLYAEMRRNYYLKQQLGIERSKHEPKRDKT